MSAWSTTVLVLSTWVVVALAAGVMLGRVVRQRDERRFAPEPATPEPVTPEQVTPEPLSPAAPGSLSPAAPASAALTADPGRPPRGPLSDPQHRQQSLRGELQRLLAEMERAELDGSPGEIADLCRIWSARAAASDAEQELDHAIEQARHNGREWSTIKIVLELPHPAPLNTAREQR